MRAKKFEAVRIQFLCDVFAAVTASLWTIRNYDGNGNERVIKQKGQGPALSARIHFCLKTEIFFSTVWPTARTYPMKTVPENACFKRLSSVEIFENACLSFSCGRTKTEVFFLRFGLRSARIQWRRSPKTHVSKHSPVWRFLKTPVYRFRVDGRKRRFSNTMVSYIIKHMPCKTCFSTSIILAFSCRRVETIRIRQSKGEL